MENKLTVANGNYYFDGGLFEYIGWQILGTLVTAFTLGICFLWAITMIYSWEASHTVLDGRRLRFTGTAIGLFGQWIKWLLLTIITFGIYGFWVNIALKNGEQNTWNLSIRPMILES